jgi:class 3 adenylate cyclase/TolB-like protein/ketosteroid isomerase-like protein
MAPDETYTRRIAAILLADVTGYSALVGEDDERTARAVQRLQQTVRAIVAEAQGYADPRSGDAIFASFDSVVAAVQAALTIQRQVAEGDFEGQRLQVRIGVHFGDVLVREGTSIGEGVGDAINIAARLEALARPGTVCISEAVYVQVRKKFDEQFIDLGNQQLKNISYPVHAYLLVPREVASQHGRAQRRRKAIGWAGAAAVFVSLLVVAMVALTHRYPARVDQSSSPSTAHSGMAIAPIGEPQISVASTAAQAPADQKQITLGVMLFKALGGDGEKDWRREALRDGLNTQLSQLSRVKVYSKEFIDFLMSREGLSDIEAATKLGITKMVSGSFVVTGGTMRIETHVVDVKTGVLESAQATTGREADFLNLQNQLVFGVISRLALPVTAEEKQQLLTQRTTDEEALKMLLEAEGGVAPNPAPQPGPEQRSALPLWLVRLQIVGVALADDTGAHAAILEALERYRLAMEARDLQTLSNVYVEFPAEQQAAQQRYFDNVRDLKISIENADIAVVGDEAVVSYTRNDNFIDTRTGRPMHVTVRLTKVLRHTDGEWKMAAGK